MGVVWSANRLCTPEERSALKLVLKGMSGDGEVIGYVCISKGLRRQQRTGGKGERRREENNNNNKITHSFYLRRNCGNLLQFILHN